MKVDGAVRVPAGFTSCSSVTGHRGAGGEDHGPSPARAGHQVREERFSGRGCQTGEGAA